MGDIELQLFSERLKDLRGNLHMTQKEFAEKINITAAALSAYENNQKNPSIAVAKRIAETFDISLDWLCGVSENQQRVFSLKNYKDVAEVIIHLITDVYNGTFQIKTIEETEYTDTELPFDNNYTKKTSMALIFPDNASLVNFFNTYEKLHGLYMLGQIDQKVIELWMESALNKLKDEPTELPFE